MATSSITHNFVISNPNSVKLFIAAIDEADRDRKIGRASCRERV